MKGAVAICASLVALPGQLYRLIEMRDASVEISLPLEQVAQHFMSGSAQSRAAGRFSQTEVLFGLCRSSGVRAKDRAICRDGHDASGLEQIVASLPRQRQRLATIFQHRVFLMGSHVDVAQPEQNPNLTVAIPT